MKYLSLSLCFFVIASLHTKAQNNVLTERNSLPSNFLSQSTYGLNTQSFWDASSRPSGAMGEGMVVFQNVNPSLASYALSLYADLLTEDLYINTGAYGTAGNNWKGWRKFLNSSNFSSYALPLSGGSITGNLGILTNDTKGYALAVNGKIHTQEVRVDMDGWSDYVFNPAYRLPSLRSVDSYVKEHHHLPDVPSETEVLEKGVSLGEMNKLLLKKVEELTLYVIQQQKEINQLKKAHRIHSKTRLTKLKTLSYVN